MAAAVSAFLKAAGLDPKSPELRQTPRLVARAWMDEFLGGYRMDPAAILRERVLANGRKPAMVVLDRIEYVSMCPHHLLPSRGVVRLAYVPGEWIVGLGQLVQLVEAFAHRLVLQEELAAQIAESLCEQLGAAGAACMVEAEHACLQLRGERQLRAVTRAEAFAGVFSTDRELRRRFLGTGK
jgi:GTP cyclohydrolase IA